MKTVSTDPVYQTRLTAVGMANCCRAPFAWVIVPSGP
jgi:hypothetical protein